MSRTPPPLDDILCTTEAGIETWMQYEKGHDLQHFCLFEKWRDPQAARDLEAYFRGILEQARREGVGLILDGSEYRASRDWAGLLGISRTELADLVAQAVRMSRSLAGEYATEDTPVAVSCAIGPRGDAYDIGRQIGAAEAEDYHAEQIETARDAGADLVSGLTLGIVEEAIGLGRAAQSAGIPVVISFSLTKDARLRTGPTLGDAIARVDDATGGAPAYYMINCNHPIDFEPALEAGAPWMERLLGVRANASSLDHGMLCQLGRLERGDPHELGLQMGELARRYPHMMVFGGCCGTDAEHIGEIARNVQLARRPGQAAAPA